MIGTYAPWYHEELARRGVAEKLSRSEALGNGGASDFPAYREQVGIIRGIELMLEIAEEIRREVDR